MATYKMKLLRQDKLNDLQVISKYGDREIKHRIMHKYCTELRGQLLDNLKIKYQRIRMSEAEMTFNIIHSNYFRII